jgi:hypothetical protein
MLTIPRLILLRPPVIKETEEKEIHYKAPLHTTILPEEHEALRVV